MTTTPPPEQSVISYLAHTSSTLMGHPSRMSLPSSIVMASFTDSGMAYVTNPSPLRHPSASRYIFTRGSNVSASSRMMPQRRKKSTTSATVASNGNPVERCKFPTTPNRAIFFVYGHHKGRLEKQSPGHRHHNNAPEKYTEELLELPVLGLPLELSVSALYDFFLGGSPSASQLTSEGSLVGCCCNERHTYITPPQKAHTPGQGWIHTTLFHTMDSHNPLPVCD